MRSTTRTTAARPQSMVTDRSGMTVVELMVATGIALLTLAVGLSLPLIAQRSLKKTQNSGSRNFSLFQTTKLISQKNTLRLSSSLLPQNESLKPCILGGASGACGADCCKAGIPTGFYAVDPFDSATDVALKAKLSGPPADPVEFNEVGDLCNPLSPPTGGCAYKVMSEFTAHCPGNAPTCDHADYISISLETEPNPGFTFKPESASLVHFVSLNYKPTIPTLADTTVTVGTSTKVAVTPDPGFPTEPREFIFEKCESSNPAIVKATCYGFVNGTAQIVLEGISKGDATITVQVNDTAQENFLSNVVTFKATAL